MSSDAIDKILGIDRNDPLTQLAFLNVRNRSQFISDLVLYRQDNFTDEEFIERLGWSQEMLDEFEHYATNQRIQDIGSYAFCCNVEIDLKFRPFKIG